MAAMVSERSVDPAAVAAPPISQSMDRRNPSGLSSGDSPSGSPAREASNRSPSSTSGPSANVDPQSQPPTRVEEYRQLFRLPPDEVLIQDFNCALQENFLLQGHMYLFVHYICFYSNLFGFETKKVIPFHEITSVRKAKTVAVFPTAIEIIAGGKKYFFTSFLFRDEAFKLINEGCVQQSNGSTDQQESKPDICSQENGSYVVEEPLDELDSYHCGKRATSLEESKHSADGETEVSSTFLAMEAREEVNAAAAQCSSSVECSAWEPEGADAPGVPEGYTNVAESKFPIQSEEFFNLFFSDDSIGFLQSFHKKCGDKDFKCTKWQPHKKFGHTREVSLQHPIKIYFGARFGSCKSVQKYRVYRNGHLILDTTEDISDVPYADYFSVEIRWDLEPERNDSEPGCTLRIYVNVAFSKKTMWKGKIVQSTIEECREVYAIWIDLAHEVLQQKNLDKRVGVSNASKLISDEKVQPEKLATTTQQHMEPQASDSRISNIKPDTEEDMNHLVNNYQQGKLNEASVGSHFGDAFANFCTHLRHLSTPSLLLVIAVAVILVLMQVSILVLLSRPQRIHVLPQAGCTGSSMCENRLEAVDSVNRHIKYLKEEMHFVETLLEKMQHEHAQLKGKLRELELFWNRGGI